MADNIYITFINFFVCVLTNFEAKWKKNVGVRIIPTWAILIQNKADSLEKLIENLYAPKAHNEDARQVNPSSSVARFAFPFQRNRAPIQNEGIKTNIEVTEKMFIYFSC